MGMVASEEYVTLIQKTVNEAVVSDREDEVIEALCAEAASNGANLARIRKRHSVMNEVTGKYCLQVFILRWILQRLAMSRWWTTLRSLMNWTP